jgi:hypothetical protein
MKPLALCLLLVAFSVQADEATKKNCDAAVDAADSMNVNQQDCDYSNEGLNGFLQKAFKKGEEGAVLETTSTEKNTAVPAAQEAPVQSLRPSKEKAEQNFMLRVEVDQWANLPVARAQLLPKALEKCGNGFAIIGEHYRSLAMGRIELALTFRCD